MSFENLGLVPGLLRAVAQKGYTDPTPIQLQAIPAVLEGRDVMGGAQTGTGKTAAFALPVLQLLHERRSHDRRPRALVLTPTRELAAQVHDSFDTYGKELRLRTAVIFGGVNINPQIERLKKGVDILVACPGRLLDHAGQKTVDLSAVEILILDEADRMLDMGFIHDIRRVLKLLPPRRQNLMFSATYSDEIRELANGVLHQPALVEVAPRNTAAETVNQVAHPVSKGRKAEMLAHLVVSGDWRRVLVFTKMKHGANRLAQYLVKEGIGAAAIHGNKSQSARTKALADFKNGDVRVLVATDIAARGLDIDQLPHVVNFELPHVPEDYIHRIGRTGRAGASGEAVSLVTQEEQPLFAAIERLLRKHIPVQTVPGFEADFSLEAHRTAHGRPPANRPLPNRPTPPRSPAPSENASPASRNRRRRRRFRPSGPVADAAR